jgi:P-type Mg2+ transporter
VCEDIGLRVSGTITGSELDGLDDDELARRLPQTTIFARVTPEQKSRVIKAQRQLGADVGFLGDGVNDAVALHDADAGISVNSATDVAKDAADIVLLDKDLAILADGITEGRRTFANTIKYVLMGTSSNFGNMFSQGAASFFLSFLPMLPKQILLNNLLYDVGEMTIPTDNVDDARSALTSLLLLRKGSGAIGAIGSMERRQSASPTMRPPPHGRLVMGLCDGCCRGS